MSVIAAALWAGLTLPAFPADTIRVRLELGPGAMDVMATYPAVGADLPVLTLWPWAGHDFAASVRDLQGTDEAGRPMRLNGTGSGQWEVPAAGAGFTLRYRVESDKASFLGSGPEQLYHPTLLDDLAVVWGESWVMRPLEPDLAFQPVRVEVVGSYEGAGFVGHGTATFDEVEWLARSVLVGGDVRRSAATATGAGAVPGAGAATSAVRLTARGDDWRFSDRDLLDAAVRIVGVQAEAMGFLPPGDLDVVLLEGAKRWSGGTAEGSVIVLYPDTDLRLDERDPETLRLLAHEHFHRWNGEYAFADPDREGRYKWFQEGVTEYLAFRTLARAGFLEPSDFTFKINQYVDEYLENPWALTATADDLEAGYWDDPSLQSLVYDKGFLLGLAIDARIQARSGGARTIWDFVREVIRPGDLSPYDDDVLLEALGSVSGDDWSQDYRSFMLGAAPLPMDRVCEDAGFDCRRDRGGPLRIHPTNRTRDALERLMR